MSARCQVTGRTAGFGDTVSHSHRRTRRRFSPNVQVSSSRRSAEDGGPGLTCSTTRTPLRVFISERGKIRARHVAGLTLQQQRQRDGQKGLTG
jgi:ribosomal protein L28